MRRKAGRRIAEHTQHGFIYPCVPGVNGHRFQLLSRTIAELWDSLAIYLSQIGIIGREIANV
jgi:hypothetical protein